MMVESSQILTAMEESENSRENATSDENDTPSLGFVERGCMSTEQEKDRRALIKAVMADSTLSPLSKRRSIQHLMDGRRLRLTNGESYRNQTKRRDINSNIGSGANNKSVNIKSITPIIGITLFSEVVPTCNDQTKRADEMRAHCPHYERNCTMIAPCCGAAFGCRICHDDSPVLPPKITAKNIKLSFRRSSFPSTFHGKLVEENYHKIDRHAVVEVICRMCYTRQSSKTNFCVSCEVQFGTYHCMECNLWMSEEQQPYHCHDCGFCRIGGTENFQHCHDCGMCIDRSLYSTHHCKPELYRTDCPVCQEYLFSSRLASHEMPCGHAIHWDCFRQIAEHDLRCPLCKKTADTFDRMAPTWEATAVSIEMQPVPPSMARVVNILCIDCGLPDTNRAWHFLGTRCVHCTSFNTLVDQIVMKGEKAHAYLHRQKSSMKAPTRKLYRRQSSRRSSIV